MVEVHGASIRFKVDGHHEGNVATDPMADVKVIRVVGRCGRMVLADGVRVALAEVTAQSIRTQAKAIGLGIDVDVFADDEVWSAAIVRCVGLGVDALC